MNQKKDYQTHVFTSTYTADVSGVCSALYELGGMTVLHDPSGCNSTYSTHDEPRWFDSDSLMYVSGLDEVTAVMGDDSVLIRDVVQAAKDLNPRFITLCGASIPHIIAFDYRGVAHLIEQECGIPVLPVPTDGLKSYVSGVGMTFSAWLERFADPKEYQKQTHKQNPRINLLGVTPLDFSINGNVEAMRKTFEKAGFTINCCMAMGDSFEQMTHAYQADCNVLVSSAGRHTARFMKRKSGLPFVEGIPVGTEMTDRLKAAIWKTLEDGICRNVRDLDSLDDGENFEKGSALMGRPNEGLQERFQIPEGEILVIGEEIFAKSLAQGVNLLPIERRNGMRAYALWPDVDEGMPEAELIQVMRNASLVIADPLYRVVLPRDTNVRFVPFPHEAYSGRIYRKDIPVFASWEFNVENLLR